jgi:CubicO group peptidase (beta-lactamase class C family)
MIPGTSRRAMLIGIGATAMYPTTASSFAWLPIPAADAGLAPDLGDRIDAAHRNGELAGLHGLVIARRGRLALERYYPGVDETWGRPLGTVAFGPDTLHDLRSVTKSLVGLLYGTALADGKVPPPDAVLVDQFPEYPDLAADPARRRLTVAHVLSMTLGLEWNEDLPYTSAANSEIAMELAPDRYRFVLERPIAGTPGLRWGYNGGATALLGRLIALGVATPLPDYARAALFAPLGITAFDWIKGQDGTPSAASGLRLAPRDLARVGQLIVQRGRWDGRPVVPLSWIEASFRPVVTIDEPVRYGLHWYLGELPVRAGSGSRREPWVGAFGNGGQRLYVVPGLELVVAITAGNYNQRDQRQMPLKLWRDLVMPSLSV